MKYKETKAAFDSIIEKHSIEYTNSDFVDVGWHPIIDKLIADLIAAGWDKMLLQCKEKFGGLRFYIGAGTSEIFDLIDKAESLSNNTCESCGAPGKRVGKGWIKTLCQSCENGPTP